MKTIKTEMLSGQWSIPTKTHCAPGSINKLGEFCQDLGLKAPLVVTDPNLALSSILKAAQQSLHEVSIPFRVFCQVPANPTTSSIQEGAGVYTSHGCDGVVAIGGGSALDAGKAIALLAKQTLPLNYFIDEGDRWTKANPFDPIIALPTTAGTGSEVGRCSVILDETQGQKLILFHPQMLPRQVILDPELTFSLPAHLTAFTGMDALSHNLEAYCVPAFSPFHDALAIRGIELIFKHLKTAYQQPSHLEARTYMMIASSLGAGAFQKGLGAMHALAHALGALYPLHHGMLNAILMPYVLKYNESMISEKLSHLAQRLDLLPDNFQGFLEWVLELRAFLGVPHTLKEVLPQGVVDKTRTLELALKDPSLAGNPLNLNLEDLSLILQGAMEGSLDFFQRAHAV